MDAGVITRRAIWFLAGLAILAVVADGLGGFRWLEFVAVAGTAAGTLSLAFYTYELARATRTAQEQTEALVRVGYEQVAAAQRQLEISKAEVAAAEQTATEAARARIDATAPLLGLLVELQPVTIPGVADVGTPGAAVIDGRWTTSELADLRIHAAIEFELVNYGASPALVFVPSLIPDPDLLVKRSGGSRQLIIPPGDSYLDVQHFHLSRLQAVEGVTCEIVATCNSLDHGATFDTLRWRGTLQPLRLENGVATYNDQIPLNASLPQFVREYPRLDRPEEMRAIAEKIRLGK
jgi:hypothetical protein